MLTLNLGIRLPINIQFENVWNKTFYTPFKNKMVELEIYKDNVLASVFFDFSIGQSHAGVSIDVGLLGYNFRFNFYDIRHWNYTEDRWEY